jgi:Secretion system C-terminal sorting domain
MKFIWLTFVLLFTNTIINAQCLSPVGGSDYQYGCYSPTSGNGVDVVVSKQGEVYHAMLDNGLNNKLTVLKYSNGSWKPLGVPGFSISPIEFVAIALDTAGEPVVAYSTYGLNTEIIVAKFNGSTWDSIGCGKKGFFLSMKIDALNRINLAFANNQKSNALAVIQYNNGLWSHLGTDSLSPPFSNYNRIGIDTAQNPYVIYTSNTAAINAIQFVANTWQPMGTTSIGSMTYYNALDLKQSKVGAPHLLYADASNGQKLKLKKFDGNNWVVVGGAAITSNASLYPKFAFDTNQNPVIIYYDTITKGVHTKIWNGTTFINHIPLGPITKNAFPRPIQLHILANNTYYQSCITKNAKLSTEKYDAFAWYYLGDTGVSASSANFVSIAIDPLTNTPYIGYREMNQGRMSVKYFANNQWNYLGTNGFSGAQTPNGCLLGINALGHKYAAFGNYENGNKLSVRKYNGTSWDTVGTPTISNGAGGPRKILFDSSNAIYVYAFNGSVSTIYKFDGNNWLTPITNLSNSITDISFNKTSLLHSITLINIGGKNKPTLWQHNGINWAMVGPINFSTNNIGDAKLCFDTSNAPIVALLEADASNNYKVSVKKLVNNTWVYIGDSLFTPSNVQRIRLEISKDNIPFLSFISPIDSGKLCVMKYNGLGWVYAGKRGFTASEVSYQSMTIDTAGKPYIAFISSTPYCYQYNGDIPISAMATPNKICNNSSTTLMASSTSLILNWIGSNGFVSANAIVNTGTLSSNTTFTATTTDADGCTNTATIAINVLPPIVASASIVLPITCGNVDGKLAVQVQGGTGGVYNYNWQPNSLTTDTVSNLGAGIYTCIVSDSLACSDTAEVILDAGIVTYNHTKNICFGQSYTVANNVYTIPGIYKDTIITSQGCDSIITTILTIDPQIDSLVTVNNGVLTANQNGASYSWFNCNNNSNVLGSLQSFTPTMNGDYKVGITVNGCLIYSNCFALQNVAIKQYVNKKDQFMVMPNPATNSVTVQMPSNIALGGSLQIFNAHGQMVFTKNNMMDMLQINTSIWRKGLYLVHYTNLKNKYTIKLQIL